MTLGRTDVPALKVRDGPRYQFRGMHLDVARNFHPKETVLRLLDQMAAYKLNKLHLHLADDEGWRIEIPGLPELTEIGAKRCHDPEEDRCLMPQLGSGPDANAPVNGYYSIADYTEILRAARARHIQVIPSLDMPGHARAAVKSMEARHRWLMAAGRAAEAAEFLLTDPDDTSVYRSIQHYSDNTINPCLESAYTFIAKVVDALQAIHARAGHPLTRYHIGADETAGAWTGSPICAAFLTDNAHGLSSVEELGPYFIGRVAWLLHARGIETAGWSDGLGETDPQSMPPLVQSNIWSLLSAGGAEIAHEHANRGWQAVLSLPDVLYFDFPHEADPQEGGYYWGARRVNTRKVFGFMPDNLPVHAEFWRDSTEQPFEIDDRPRTDESGPLRRAGGFAGIQGQLWSETVTTRAGLAYQIFPRMIALAERAWHRADWEVPYNFDGAVYSQETSAFTREMRTLRDRDWARFATALAIKEFPKLERAGIAYRLPTAGARIEGGLLEANTIFPGLGMEFRDGAGPWRSYEPGIAVDGAVEIRAVSPDGRRKGRSLWVGGK